MSSYLIYGKVIAAGCVNGKFYDKPQSTFRALNKYGCRVNKLSDAYKYETKEAAQNKLNHELQRMKHKDKVAFEIRRV